MPRYRTAVDPQASRQRQQNAPADSAHAQSQPQSPSSNTGDEIDFSKYLDDDAVVGYVAGHLSRRYGCAGELQWMNVIPEQRGTAVAGKLLRLLAKWFVKQRALRICVNVDPANAAARRFYAKHGAERLNDQWLMWNDIRTVLRNQQTRAPSAI